MGYCNLKMSLSFCHSILCTLYILDIQFFYLLSINPTWKCHFFLSNYNKEVGSEDSWESLGLQGDQTSQS